MLTEFKFKKSLIEWIESLVITLLFLIMSEIVNDPLSLKSYFPWIWFAPVVIALRYGLWPSQFSILLLLISYLYRYPTDLYSIHLQLFTLGGFLLTLACVIYQSIWLNKITSSDKISDYLQKRILSTAYAYKIMLLAYRGLEHEYIARPITIRSSLNELRELMARSDEAAQEVILTRFLNILALRCSIDVCGIFPVKNNSLVTTPITSIGKLVQPQQNDFLIQESIEKSKLAYVSIQEILKGHSSQYLVVAPFLDQEDKIYALLIIQEMPFLKLNEDNLETLNLLIQYFVESKIVKNANLILEKFPDCTVNFANELQRLANLQKITKKNSGVAAFIFSDTPHKENYLFTVKEEKRGIDTIWEKRVGKNIFLLVLMPFTDMYGIENYKIRINKILSNNFNVTLDTKEIKFKSYQVSSFHDPIHLLQDLLSST